MREQNKEFVGYLVTMSGVVLAGMFYLACSEMGVARGMVVVIASVLVGWMVSMVLIDLTARRYLHRVVLYVETWGPNDEHKLEKTHLTVHGLAYKRAVSSELRRLMDQLVDDEGFKLKDVTETTNGHRHYQLETEDGQREAEVYVL